MASFRWEVLGCTPLPHRAETSSDPEGEEPLSQAVCTQHTPAPGAPEATGPATTTEGLPGHSILPGQQKPGGEGGRLPVRPLGYLRSTSSDKFHG